MGGVCLGVGVFGALGSYALTMAGKVGLNKRDAALTVGLTLTTLVALKALFGISPCVEKGITLKNIVSIGAFTLLIGGIYTLGIRYLLGRNVVPQNPHCPAHSTEK
mgnify:CR=1 FL=1